MNNRSKVMSFFLRSAPLVAGALLMILVFKDIDVNETAGVILGIGAIFPALLIFYLVGTLFDTLAWQMLLHTSGRPLPFLRLLLIHIAGESFYRFLPAGVVVGESFKVILVKKYSQLTTPEIISSLTMRKLLMGMAQALYIGLAVFVGIEMSDHRTDGPLLGTGMVISSFLLILFAALGYFLVKGNLGASLYALLMKIPFRSFRKIITRNHAEFISTDSVIRESIMKRRGYSVIAGSLFFFGWLTELAETYGIMMALQSTVPFTKLLVFEPIVSFLRSVVFFIPAGLGVMDFGYSSSLQSVNAVGTVAAAFIIIKRTKELFWIVIGVCLTAFLGNTQNGKTVFHFSSDVIPDLAPATNTVNK